MFEMVVGLMYEMGGVCFCETRATMLYDMGIVFVFEMRVVQLYGMGFYYCLRWEVNYTKRSELHNYVR